MAFWLLKTEPSTYSWSDLLKAKRATWDGVKNPTALRNLRDMKVGDLAFIYHTGDEKAIVGIAKVVKAAYPDPKAGDASLVVVDLEAVKPLKTPVTLAAIKADKRYAAWALVRIPRLSVMPVDPEHWKQLSSSS
jgi:predicted RNA-binding protein with PUA-like domain